MARGQPWTGEEDAILRREYPWRGSGCEDSLPGRTPKAIVYRAFILGVRLRRDGSTNHSAESATSRPLPDNAPKRGPIFPIPEDTRDLTARFCGDPMPGRSALDRRAGA